MSLNISTFEPMGEYRLRPIKLFDVAPVVGVHMSSFANFFLTFLGPAFLKELYKGTITDPTGIAFEPENPESLAYAVKKLSLMSKTERNKIAACGKHFYHNKLDFAAGVTHIEQSFRRTINSDSHYA